MKAIDLDRFAEPDSGHLIGSGTTLYLGTHQINWLARFAVPLFVSHRRLRKYKQLPRAAGPYAVDSGGFTELNLYGEWTVTPEDYVAAILHYEATIGRMDWCAPQDWMCEPVIRAKTGLSVIEHQRRTVANFVRLRELWADASDDDPPFMPVLQGWEPADYFVCWDLYEEAGVDLSNMETVGLGSVCRRQASDEIAEIVAEIRHRDPGMPLHGFGTKSGAIAKYGPLLASCDSMAWSFGARKRRIRLPGCTHQTCSNCPKYALAWRARLLSTMGWPVAAPRLPYVLAA